MISEIKLVNFRNFSYKKIDNLQEKNYIIGENGKGKTNILEALSLLGNNQVNSIHIENLIKKNETHFYIEYLDEQIGKVGISYDHELKKKKYLLNGKSFSKNKFLEVTYTCVVFSPQAMNLLYLSPSLRRDFLDTILSNAFPEYHNILKQYKKIVTSRNKLLKNIAEGKSQKTDIHFWNTQFIETAYILYSFRFPLIRYFQSHIHSAKEYFNDTVTNINFIYNTKVTEENIRHDIQNYLSQNFERDIILGKTAIGPHVDDFHIMIDNTNIIEFASRGETKSVIIWLKLLEAVFIEKKTGKKPLLFIDDLMSELDESHKDLLSKKIKYYQTFVSSISQLEEKGNIKL
ncbi:MAG: DNA replication/repair protein RecF [Candidatus Gracilibacteria bacterium]|nr:DNA replication/repair protein RecF [Candidatus Gracilibacteria bacterium]